MRRASDIRAARATAGRTILAQIDAVDAQLRTAVESLELASGDIPRGSGGGGWAHFDATLGEALAALSRVPLERTVAALRAEWLPMVRDAVDRWPVSTGKSKDGLRLIFDASSGALRSRLVSEADYTKYMRFGQQRQDGGKMVWQTLVAAPVRGVARRMVDRISGRRSS